MEQNVEINVFGPKNKVRNCYMSVEKINVTMNNQTFTAQNGYFLFMYPCKYAKIQYFYHMPGKVVKRVL